MDMFCGMINFSSNPQMSFLFGYSDEVLFWILDSQVLFIVFRGINDVVVILVFWEY